MNKLPPLPLGIFFSLFLVCSATYKYLKHFATASASTSCNLNLELFLDGPEIPLAAIIFDPNCNLPRLYVNVMFIIEIKSFSAHKKSKIDGVSGATNMYTYLFPYI